MKFCPKCGSIMKGPIKSGERLKYMCTRCGYEETVANAEGQKALTFKSEVKRNPKDKLLVIDSRQASSTAQVVKGVVCPKCGHEEAFFWMMQTRAADEPPTRFYKCTKCGYTWREYA